MPDSVEQGLVTDPILGRRPSLDLPSFYTGRPKAYKEVEEVLRSYLWNDETLDTKRAEQKATQGEDLAIRITTPVCGNRNEEILTALSAALDSRSSAASESRNAARKNN